MPANAAAAVVLAILLFSSGCVSLFPGTADTRGQAPAGPPAGGGNRSGPDIRYVLSPPHYLSPSWFESPRWTVDLTVMNTGTAAADGYCMKVSLVTSRDDEPVESRYVQYACRGCMVPGAVRRDRAVFSLGWQEEGTYRAVAESCGGAWDPVFPA